VLRILGLDLFSHEVSPILSLALTRFTSEFGMESGGSMSLKRPRNFSTKHQFYLLIILYSENQREKSLLVLWTKIKFFRPIRTDKLKALLPFHCLPINLVFFQGSIMSSHLEVGFPLRCFQRLSFRNIATRRCR
jgi:hypothetical protein